MVSVTTMKLSKIFITLFVFAILSSCVLFPPTIEDIIDVGEILYDSDNNTVSINFTWLDSTYTLKEITVYRYLIDRWEAIDTITSLTFSDPIELANTSYTPDYTKEGYKYKFSVSFTKGDGKVQILESEKDVWVTVKGEVVWYTDTGTKYHRHSCHYLYSFHPTTKEQAITMGLTACSVCRP